MDDERSDRGRGGGEALDELEQEAAIQLERLHTRPELKALLAEIKRDLEPEEAARIENDARRGAVAGRVVRVPAQEVAVATARVVLRQASRPLEEVARDAGLAVEDFQRLEAASPRARTQIALRVLERIDAFYAAADKTLGGTARLPRPEGVADARLREGARSDAPPSSRPPRSAPPSSRNITGTERLPVPEEVKKGITGTARIEQPEEVKKGITGTERLEQPAEVKQHPRNVTGTEVLPVPDEVRERAAPAPTPSPVWLAAIVAILVAVVLLALFR